MHHAIARLALASFLVVLLGNAAPVPAYAPHPVAAIPLATNVIVPQSRAFALSGVGQIEITDVTVGVVIQDQAATTTMDISLANRGGGMQEAELLVPVPDGAVVRGFDFEGAGAEPSARLLPVTEATATYESIVARIRDPALLEFAGHDLVRSSVFPVPAGGTQKVRLTYEHLLPAEGNRVDYVLPRSESLAHDLPWTVHVQIESSQPIATVYSPSHEIDTVRGAGGRVSVKLAEGARTVPGALRLSYLLEQDGVAATLFAYPDGPDGGYFLMLAGVPELGAGERTAVRREVTLVIDQSGSMGGDKIEQAREAARQVVAGLADGERFNVIAYSDTVSPFAAEAVEKSDETEQLARVFLDSIRAQGGTNLHDALIEALRPEPEPEVLPMVLFLTDGLPTVGVTSEVAIREAVAKANAHERRIFCFGVGYDVNAPLLDELAGESRATAEYVLPDEDVELEVASVFRHLSGPVLAGTELRFLDAAGRETPGRVLDVLPRPIPDLFDGDQLVLLGRYSGHEPLHATLTGDYLGRPRTFLFKFELDAATTRNAFVPRLWASRRIALLADEVRQLGADPAAVALASTAVPLNAAGYPIHSAYVSPAAVTPSVALDPRVDELVDEIVRLGTEHGILTEYTAFLATEGSDLSDRDAVLAQARHNFQSRAMGTRSGVGAVNQSMNYNAQAQQSVLNPGNEFYDASMNRVQVTTVQQVNDRAFFQRGERWVDSRLVERDTPEAGARTVAFGSDEHLELARTLAAEGRGGVVSLPGEILLVVDGETILISY